MGGLFRRAQLVQRSSVPRPPPPLHTRDNSIHLEEVKLDDICYIPKHKKWLVLYELEASGIKTDLRHSTQKLEQIFTLFKRTLRTNKTNYRREKMK